MIVKVIAQIENDFMEKIIEIVEDTESLNNFEKCFDEVVKTWQEKCKGMKCFHNMFDLFEELLSENNIGFYCFEDNVDTIIKAKG